MSRFLTRRAVLAGLAASAAASAAGAAPPERSLRPVARPVAGPRAVEGPERLLREAGLSGDISFAVVDVETGHFLEGHRANLGLPPASVAKALTALYALDVLGEAHRFSTRLLGTGPIENGVLKGDLVLEGGGDPVLDTDGLFALAADLKDAGIATVEGDFIVADGALPYVFTIDPGQPDHLAYSPAVGGLALNFNRVHFRWERGDGDYDIHMEAPGIKARPSVDCAAMRIEDRDGPVYTYRLHDGLDQWTVRRDMLGTDGARWLPVRDPSVYAADVFRTFARTQGILLDEPRFTRDAPEGARQLAILQSPPLREILEEMLRHSTNITAEMVGLAATRARTGQVPADLRASAAEMSRWADERLGMSGSLLVDHSGLGEDSRVMSRDLAGALSQVADAGLLRPLLKPFGLRDARGRPDPGHPLAVDAKTGTLNFVSGLGGFVTLPGGRDLAFAIFSADEKVRAAIPREMRERPDGARAWNRRAKALQQSLIERWAEVFGE